MLKKLNYADYFSEEELDYLKECSQETANRLIDIEDDADILHRLISSWQYDYSSQYNTIRKLVAGATKEELFNRGSLDNALEIMSSVILIEGVIAELKKHTEAQSNDLPKKLDGESSEDYIARIMQKVTNYIKNE